MVDPDSAATSNVMVVGNTPANAPTTAGPVT
jgi:hypothetical protein